MNFRWGRCYNGPPSTKGTRFLVYTSCIKFRGDPLTYKCQISKTSASRNTLISFNFTSVGVWFKLPSSGNIWNEIFSYILNFYESYCSIIYARKASSSDNLNGGLNVWIKAISYGPERCGRWYMPRDGKAEYDFPVMRYLCALGINNTQKISTLCKVKARWLIGKYSNSCEMQPTASWAEYYSS